jgi:hypothetical protein
MVDEILRLLRMTLGLSGHVFWVDLGVSLSRLATCKVMLLPKVRTYVRSTLPGNRGNGARCWIFDLILLARVSRNLTSDLERSGSSSVSSFILN